MDASARRSDSAAPPDDTDLMLAFAAGDAGAFDSLYGRHRGGVYRYLLRHCRDAAVAQELFQDVWLRVVRARRTYAPAARFATWLYRIAHNRLVDHWRALGATPTLVSTEAEETLPEIPAGAGSDPLVLLERQQLGERLLAALGALPAEQRDVFLLHYEAGLALKEIATITGAPFETVKSRLRYATSRLRQFAKGLA